jgi:anti-sigma factor ChrR (cupin superfamily)
MSPGPSHHEQDYLELVFLYAMQALPARDVPGAEVHLASCAECRQELETLRPVIGAFVSWPTDILRPATSLWERVARRIAADTGQAPMVPPVQSPAEAEWQEAAPGLAYKVLAANTENDRVSLLVRLAPGAHYPPHRHAGVEELYLLHGELWIDDKKLDPGEYTRAEPGTGDQRIWSETGCTCVLLTSMRDVLW